MSKITNLVIIVMLLSGIGFTSGCKKEEFTPASTIVQLNGTPEEVAMSGIVSTSTGDMLIYFQGSKDDQLQDFGFSFNKVPTRAFRYGFGQSDEVSEIEINLIMSHDGDALCDVYNIDGMTSTNFIEITEFNETSCLLIGAYDLTFISERGASGCQNPRFPEIIRLVSDRFELIVEGC